MCRVLRNIKLFSIVNIELDTFTHNVGGGGRGACNFSTSCQGFLFPFFLFCFPLFSSSLFFFFGGRGGFLFPIFNGSILVCLKWYSIVALTYLSSTNDGLVDHFYITCRSLSIQVLGPTLELSSTPFLLLSCYKTV